MVKAREALKSWWLLLAERNRGLSWLLMKLPVTVMSDQVE